jgi:hypothetical protein
VRSYYMLKAELVWLEEANPYASSIYTIELRPGFRSSVCSERDSRGCSSATIRLDIEKAFYPAH